jgi:iron complex transport system permease protein
VRRTQRLTFVGAGLTTAAAVALTGPIGFVGMMVPHAVRAVSGVQHRAVLPGSFLLGGAVLAACDAAARTALAPTEIPVGIVTAVLGAPLFLRVLTRRRDA